LVSKSRRRACCKAGSAGLQAEGLKMSSDFIHRAVASALPILRPTRLGWLSIHSDCIWSLLNAASQPIQQDTVYCLQFLPVSAFDRRVEFTQHFSLAADSA